MQDAYNLGWKIAAVLDGAPAALPDSYEDERRPIAAHMLGLAAALLEAAKQGSMRRRREVHQLDIGYPGSPLSLERPERRGGVLASDRAPDVPLTGAAGQPVRLFELLKGPHWTAIGYDAARDTMPRPRKNLHLYRVGSDGDLKDTEKHFATAYGIEPGGWVAIRPDGYVGAVVDSGGIQALDDHLSRSGLL